MVAPDPVSRRPTVSVIVPARNEEASLGACLESLVGQTGASFEVIVVDDGSTDGTRKIAESFSGIRVIEPGPLPPGWSGKNNAVVAGANAAQGDWLLFTDADTVHLPGSLARSLTEAEREGAALLSYSPEQEVHGFWEKAVMPVIFAELASTFRPSEVSDPASPVAAANGQYILVKRDAYDAVGGHAAVATSLLEDVALAKLMKASGRRIFFRFGGDAVRTRMYRSFPQLREGWTKNLALLFQSPLRLAAWRLVEFFAILSAAILAVASALSGRRDQAMVAALAAIGSYAVFLGRIRKAHFSWDADLLALVGLPMFSCFLLRSRFAHKRGRVTWKEREYAPTASGQGSGPTLQHPTLGGKDENGLSHAQS